MSLIELINECVVAAQSPEKKEPGEVLTLAGDLRKLGFEKIAKELSKKAQMKEKLQKIAGYKYICITDKKIKAFLTQKAERYNLKNTEMKSMAARFIGEQEAPLSYNTWWSRTSILERMMIRGEATGPVLSLYAPTVHLMSDISGTIGKFVWTETPLKDYGAVPPERILQALKTHQARNVFDYFTIATVNAIKDPLLLGRLEGVEDRFFCAQWDDDVSLDDLI